MARGTKHQVERLQEVNLTTEPFKVQSFRFQSPPDARQVSSKRESRLDIRKSARKEFRLDRRCGDVPERSKEQRGRQGHPALKRFDGFNWMKWPISPHATTTVPANRASGRAGASHTPESLLPKSRSCPFGGRTPVRPALHRLTGGKHRTPGRCHSPLKLHWKLTSSFKTIRISIIVIHTATHNSTTATTATGQRTTRNSTRTPTVPSPPVLLPELRKSYLLGDTYGTAAVAA